jgi:hypothetical protein
MLEAAGIVGLAGGSLEFTTHSSAAERKRDERRRGMGQSGEQTVCWRSVTALGSKQIGRSAAAG